MKKTLTKLLKQMMPEVGQQIFQHLKKYLADGKEKGHLYDVAHLLKEIRNALLKYNLRFKQDDVDKEASWDHLKETI
jgi:hypothetical protein